MNKSAKQIFSTIFYLNQTLGAKVTLVAKQE